MDDAVRVRFRERVGHLFGDAQRVCHWQVAASQSIGERFTFDVLHRDEMLAGVLADFVNRAHIGVVERRRGLRLLYQPRVGCPIRPGFRAQDFDGDEPVERRVLAQIHLAHAPGAELPQDAISTDGLWMHLAVEGDYDSIEEDMTVLGINAGFGDPIAGEFPFFERIGVAAVRQDLFAHGDTVPIEALVAEFSNRPTRAIFMLAGGKMQVADGSNRIEPHVLAARAGRVVEAARAVGLQQHLRSATSSTSRTTATRVAAADFAEAIRQVHAVVRPLGFEGDLITGGVSNLNQRGLAYLQSMLTTPAVPGDVVIRFHRYPEAGRGAEVPHRGFESRDEEFEALAGLVGGRRVACTEFGYHTAEDRMGAFSRRRRSESEVADSVRWDLNFFAQRHVLLSAIYQLNDGTRDVAEERYGVRRLDGRPSRFRCCQRAARASPSHYAQKPPLSRDVHTHSICGYDIYRHACPIASRRDRRS
jgi:hypothetical protein